MNLGGYELERYYVSYKLQLQEDEKRESQEKEKICTPVISLPQPQEIEVYHNDETKKDSDLDDVVDNSSFMEDSVLL